MRKLITLTLVALSMLASISGCTPDMEDIKETDVQSISQDLNGTRDFCNFEGCSYTLKEGCQGLYAELCASKTIFDVVGALKNLGYNEKWITDKILCRPNAVLPSDEFHKIDGDLSFQAIHVYFTVNEGVVGFGNETDTWSKDCGVTRFYGVVPPEACGTCPQN